MSIKEETNENNNLNKDYKEEENQNTYIQKSLPKYGSQGYPSHTGHKSKATLA